jgi:hypothetical protein
MTRTEFYKELQDHGKGHFALDPKGRIRTPTGHDPLSFVTWKLHGIEALGEINRPAKLLGIKNPMRLVLASDLMRGFVGSTRRALLTALALSEMDAAARRAALVEGAQPDPRSGRVIDYDPDEEKDYAHDMPADEGDVLPGGQVVAPVRTYRCTNCDASGQTYPGTCADCQANQIEVIDDSDDSSDESECDCDDCRRERGELD